MDGGACWAAAYGAAQSQTRLMRLSSSSSSSSQPYGPPCGSDGNVSASNVGDLGSILGSENLLEKEMATHSSMLAWKNHMDGEAWWATARRVAKSRT